MKHSFLDRFADRDGILQHADPRIKLLATLSFVITATFIPPQEPVRFLLLVALITPFILASRVPLYFLFSRLLILSPFFILAGITLPFTGNDAVVAHVPLLGWSIRLDGLDLFLVLIARGFLSLLCLMLFITTTPFGRLLQALRTIKLPTALINTLDLMYRYVFVLADEGERIMRARDVRWQGRRPLGEIKVLGRMVGWLWIRSYERGVRVSRAMLARGGLTGRSIKFNSNDFRLAQWAVGLILIGSCILILCLPLKVIYL